MTEGRRRSFNMRILITGWYGTETLGDRSILLGLLIAMKDAYGRFAVNIASLYPFLTQRTLFEDGLVIANYISLEDIGIVDAKSKEAMQDAIDKSDLIVLGGGPLMDIAELLIIRYAFRLAKRKGKKTAVLGCGIGPLRVKAYSKIVNDILELSDTIVLRDKISFEWIIRMCSFQVQKRSKYTHDPAVIPIQEYLSTVETKWKSDEIAVNFREYPVSALGVKSRFDDAAFVSLVQTLSDGYAKVLLIPMHTFFMGGDDREFLSRIAYKTKKDNVFVLHKPSSLFETFALFHNAGACIGMRYHSIVFQTLLNGNNFILDYTDRSNGKIASFLDILGAIEAYADRYFSLQDTAMGPSDSLLPRRVIDTLKQDRAQYDYTYIFGETRDRYRYEFLSLLE
jgi:polysaccharide pyruvyl transferase WcaK-like protein